MAETSNRKTCAPAAIIPARAPRRRLVNPKPSGSASDQYLRPATVARIVWVTNWPRPNKYLVNHQ
jgi:hypothetical protein